MNVTPIGNNVIIEVEEIGEEVSPGGIILPDIKDHTFKERFLMGTVRAIGPGKPGKNGVRLAPDVRAGQRCLFMDHALHRELTREPRQIICDADNIFARMDDDET